MKSVLSVALDTVRTAEDVNYAVKIILNASPDSSELQLPLRPVFEALNEQLREPYIVLSQKEAEDRAAREGYETVDRYESLTSTLSLGRALESACQANTSLLLSEDAHFYKPRFGREQDSVSIAVMQSWCCEDHHGDGWNATVIESELRLITTSIIIGCGEFSLCRFEVKLTFYGGNEVARQAAIAVVQRLSLAYGV